MTILKLAWALVELLFGDVIDLALFALMAALGYGLLWIAWPASRVALSQGKIVLSRLLRKHPQDIGWRPLSVLSGPMLFISVLAAYKYYATLPWDYVVGFGWRPPIQQEAMANATPVERNTLQFRELPAKYKGHDRKHDMSWVYHYNVLCVIHMESWYLRYQFYQSQSMFTSLFCFGNILDAIRILIAGVWSLAFALSLFVSPFALFAVGLIYHSAKTPRGPANRGSESDPMGHSMKNDGSR